MAIFTTMCFVFGRFLQNSKIISPLMSHFFHLSFCLVLKSVFGQWCIWLATGTLTFQNWYIRERNILSVSPRRAFTPALLSTVFGLTFASLMEGTTRFFVWSGPDLPVLIFGNSVMWIHIGYNADPDPAFYRSVYPDPDPVTQTNANQCGSWSKSRSCSDFTIP